MPFMRGDAESFDGMMDELGEDATEGGQGSGGEFEYSDAEGRFDLSSLKGQAAEILTLLRSKGATGFRVRYDGGYDEGFSHSDAVYFGAHPRHAEEVAEQLGTPEVVANFRAMALSGDTIWGGAESMYAEASDSQVMVWAMDELAQVLAVKLLGDGFGTGEYQLYGEFIADLETGELKDDPGASMPDSVR